MHLRNLIRFLLVHLIGVAMFLGSTAFAVDLASQSNESGGVTIVVKPIDVGPGVATWTFDVSISSDGRNLSDDLARTAYIVNRAANKNQPPIAWEGDAPGGRSRKGVLRFKPLVPQPTAINLRIQRQGEKAPRVFVWDLGCPCNDPKMHKS